MLVTESQVDIPMPAPLEGQAPSSMRIFLFHPNIGPYPEARFPAIVLFSEIYQVTGPVARFARQIAGQGYIVAAPSSYHDFIDSTPLAYDVAGTDLGNSLKVKKTLQSYDADSRAAVDYLLKLATCTGRIGTTGMCLGGHLALRACLDRRISACVTYFATDVHTRTLGPNSGPNSASESPPDGGSDHTLDRLGEISAELVLIFGVNDTHVAVSGRTLIRNKLLEAGVTFSFCEFAWAQHAFIRDELSKGRYDPALTKTCFGILLDLFDRALKTELGPRQGALAPPEHVC